MEQVRNIDTAIENIRSKANAVSELRAKKVELKLRQEGLAAQLSQGIHGDGDSAKLAQKLAPIQTEILIAQVRESAKEREIEVADRAFLSACYQEVSFVHRTGKEWLSGEERSRIPKITSLLNEWQIPQVVRKQYPIAVSAIGDSLQWHRDMLGELSEFVNRSQLGREIVADQIIRVLNQCRCWFPEPAAAEETTTSK